MKKQRKHFNDVKFVNISASVCKREFLCLKMLLDIKFDDKYKTFCVKKIMTIAIRTFYVFCCRNKEWENRASYYIFCRGNKPLGKSRVVDILKYHNSCMYTVFHFFFMFGIIAFIVNYC